MQAFFTFTTYQGGTRKNKILVEKNEDMYKTFLYVRYDNERNEKITLSEVISMFFRLYRRRYVTPVSCLQYLSCTWAKQHPFIYFPFLFVSFRFPLFALYAQHLTKQGNGKNILLSIINSCACHILTLLGTLTTFIRVVFYNGILLLSCFKRIQNL